MFLTLKGKLFIALFYMSGFDVSILCIKCFAAKLLKLATKYFQCNKCNNSHINVDQM